MSSAPEEAEELGFVVDAVGCGVFEDSFLWFKVFAHFSMSFAIFLAVFTFSFLPSSLLEFQKFGPGEYFHNFRMYEGCLRENERIQFSQPFFNQFLITWALSKAEVMCF